MRKTWIVASVVVLGACATLPPEVRERMADIGESVARVGGAATVAALPIGPEKEREIGFGIAATVAGRYGLVDDPELTRYVNLVGQAVAQQSVRWGEVPFRFAVLDTDDVNAFAAPGGYIFITRGALGLMESEAELAGVLAHEVAHVDEKHVLDDIRRADVMKTVQEESEIDSALLDRIAELGSSLLFTGLSREDEMQADSLGVLYAAATGYRADGLLHFLEHLHQAEAGGDEGLREWTATHPSTADRIAAVERHLAAQARDAGDGRLLVDRFRRHTGGGD